MKKILQEKEKLDIRENYSNRLLIIDEVHNLREASKKTGIITIYTISIKI